jgi:hypothetical protein
VHVSVLEDTPVPGPGLAEQVIGLLGLDFGFAASAEDGTSINIETRAIAIIAVVVYVFERLFFIILSHICVL